MKFLKHLYEDLDNYLKNQEKIQDIYQVFVDFYGEDNVDLQNNFDLSAFKNYLYDTPYTDFISDNTYNSLKSCPISKIKHLITEYQNNKDIYLKRFLNLYSDNLYCYIIVYFPKITITNEYNESIDIEEVYIRVPITFKGKMKSAFEIIRTKYSYDQYKSGYMHSHAHSGINKTSSDWRSMCLGSGPLVTTTHTLKNNYDLDIWRLFCIELDEYLKVESVAGVPYIRMNRVGNNTNLAAYITRAYDYCCMDVQYKIMCYSDFFKDFLKFFIWRLCKIDNYFAFRDANICLAISDEQFAIIASRYFIEYCNYRKLDIDLNIIIPDYMVLVQRDVSGMLRYNTQTNSSNYNHESSSSTKALTFKGQDKYVNVDAPANTNNREIYLLKPVIVSQILNYILKIVNYGNTKEFTTNSKIPYFI